MTTALNSDHEIICLNPAASQCWEKTSLMTELPEIVMAPTNVWSRDPTEINFLSF
jgi:hypothetical protein